MTEATAVAPRARLLGYRALALFYDLWPVVALWFVTAIPFVLIDAALSNNVRHNVEPFSALAWLQWLACWAVTGVYATVSWRRGGQTLGMRPWRLHVRTANGQAGRYGQLWLRYLVGTASLLLAGVGFWWALVDRRGLTWHDRASATVMQRQPRT